MLLRVLIILCIQGMLFSQSSVDINRLKKEAKKLGVTDSQIKEAIKSQSQNDNINLSVRSQYHSLENQIAYHTLFEMHARLQNQFHSFYQMVCI